MDSIRTSMLKARADPTRRVIERRGSNSAREHSLRSPQSGIANTPDSPESEPEAAVPAPEASVQRYAIGACVIVKRSDGNECVAAVEQLDPAYQPPLYVLRLANGDMKRAREQDLREDPGPAAPGGAAASGASVAASGAGARRLSVHKQYDDDWNDKGDEGEKKEEAAAHEEPEAAPPLTNAPKAPGAAAPAPDATAPAPDAAAPAPDATTLGPAAAAPAPRAAAVEPPTEPPLDAPPSPPDSEDEGDARATPAAAPPPPLAPPSLAPPPPPPPSLAPPSLAPPPPAPPSLAPPPPPSLAPPPPPPPSLAPPPPAPPSLAPPPPSAPLAPPPPPAPLPPMPGGPPPLPLAPGGGGTKTYKQRKAEEAARETARKELEYAAPADFAMAAGHALTDAEKYVLEQKGTEAAGTGTYEGFFPTDGYFACRKCGAPIYSAKSKFESGCGWPAFDKCYEGAVEHRVETDGTERIEIVCAHCKGHLGHIFMGEAKTATGERHCANSRALQFVKAKVDKKEVKLGPLD
jgi:methionine-R-sulfoxide reductase